MLREIDKQMMERLAGRNPLGWRPHSRDEDGNAIFKTVLGAGSKNPGKVRHCYLKLTPAGIVYGSELKEATDGQG